MKLLPRLRRRQSSALVLGPMLAAWLGVILTPCAMALSIDEAAIQVTASVGVHADCANAKASQQPMTDSDCCCDLTAFTGAKTPELVKSSAVVVALPTEVTIDLRIQRRELSIVHQRPPPHENALPVYLSTQRLRI